MIRFTIVYHFAWMTNFGVVCSACRVFSVNQEINESQQYSIHGCTCRKWNMQDVTSSPINFSLFLLDLVVGVCFKTRSLNKTNHSIQTTMVNTIVVHVSHIPVSPLSNVDFNPCWDSLSALRTGSECSRARDTWRKMSTWQRHNVSGIVHTHFTHQRLSKGCHFLFCTKKIKIIEECTDSLYFLYHNVWVKRHKCIYSLGKLTILTIVKLGLYVCSFYISYVWLRTFIDNCLRSFRKCIFIGNELCRHKYVIS